jgi:hypothetical protein
MMVMLVSLSILIENINRLPQQIPATRIVTTTEYGLCRLESRSLEAVNRLWFGLVQELRPSASSYGEQKSDEGNLHGMIE